MSRQVKLFILVFLLPFPVFAQQTIGIPCQNKGWYARNIWDEIIYHHKLYVGCGDANGNAGPIDVWSYSQNSGWVNEYTVDEEAIIHFDIIDDTLIIPGTDAREDWSLGNWYELGPNGWIKHRNIPNALHVFDIIDFDGQRFAGLGVTEGGAAVAISRDKGRTWKTYTVPYGARTSNTNCTSQFYESAYRVTNLFIIAGELYADTDGYYVYDCNFDPPKKVNRYELLHWDGKNFQLVDIYPFLVASIRAMISPTMFASQVVYIGRDLSLGPDSATVFAMGGDLTPRAITLSNCTIPGDIVTDNAALYILCNTQQARGWQVSVQMSCDLMNWREVYSEAEPTFAGSLAVDGGTLYFSLGGVQSEPPEIQNIVGKIIQVDQFSTTCP